MIHEILLALLGHVGGLLSEAKDADGFVLDPEVDCLTGAERNLIEHAVKVGFYYKQLSEFVASIRKHHLQRAAGAAGGTGAGVFGHYAYGLAKCIEAALDAYQERVVTLEAQVLHEPSLPLAHICSASDDDRRTLLVLHRLVKSVEAGGLSGGPLLDLVWQTAAGHMGTGKLYERLWSVVSGIGQVFANQVVAWAVYGRIVDPDNEFFIGRVWDQQLPWQSGYAWFGGPVEDFGKATDADSAQREWQGLFFLRSEAVPHTVISLETARKVLFVGKAVRVLLRSGRWLAIASPNESAATTSKSGKAAASTTKGFHVPEGTLEAVEVQEEVDALRTCFNRKSPPFVVEHSIERIRKNVAAQLRQLVVGEAALVQHLVALKGFFLLGYGFFYQTLLEAARPLLRRTPPAHAEIELVHGPWTVAMAEHETSKDSEKSFASRFQIRFVPHNFELHSFTDAARHVKLVGMARLAGGHAEMGLGPGAVDRGGAAQAAMVWLVTRQRISHSFGHAFSFQVHAPPTAGASGGPTDHGCRFALCVQHKWSPVDLQRMRHASVDGHDAVDIEKGSGRVTRGAEGSLWTDLGECLALEITYRALPNKGLSTTPSAEVTMALYVCHPGLGDGRRCIGATAARTPVQQLAVGRLKTSAPRSMVHLVRLWYNAQTTELQAFFGADAVAPTCVAKLDISATISLDLGCGYIGFCLLPLEHQHHVIGGKSKSVDALEVRYSALDRPVSIVSWRHTMHAVSPTAASKQETEAWFTSTELSYRAPWPLPLVITRESLEQYNRIFKLLLAFKHVHLELQHLDLPRKNTLAWALRSEFSYFVSQVLLYFQQDVIEAAHHGLLQAVDASQEFNDVIQAHEEFLSIATTNCFLRAPELHGAIMSALRTASSFCSTTRESDKAGSAKTREMLRLQSEFLDEVRSILSMMITLHRQGAHLRMPQLLLRLDYNGYFSGTGSTGGS